MTSSRRLRSDRQGTLLCNRSKRLRSDRRDTLFCSLHFRRLLYARSVESRVLCQYSIFPSMVQACGLVQCGSVSIHGVRVRKDRVLSVACYRMLAYFVKANCCRSFSKYSAALLPVGKSVEFRSIIMCQCRIR